MKVIVVMFAILLGFNIRICYSQENSLVTNIYTKTMYVYSDYVFLGRQRTPEYFFSGVRGGGVNFELDGIHLARFTNLVEIVSNNCVSIAADWHTYETNEMVRFTVLSAVGYSGYDNYTNFVNTVITPSCSLLYTNRWASVKFLLDPYGTEMEHQLALNYESSGISNIVQKIKAESVLQGNTNYVNWCNKILSGEWKRWYLDMKMSGAL